jgi:hypothetical protein
MLDRHMFHTGGLLTGVVLTLLEIVFIKLELSDLSFVSCRYLSYIELLKITQDYERHLN